MFWKILVQIAWMALRGVLLASMTVLPTVAGLSAPKHTAVLSASLAVEGQPPAASAEPISLSTELQMAAAGDPVSAPQIAVMEALSIFPDALPGGVQDVDYAQGITISGGTLPYQVNNDLDPAVTGLAFAGSGGQYTVIGKPKVAGDVVFVVTASDSSDPAQTVMHQYLIEVKPASAPPAISVLVIGEYGKNDWYRSDVTVHWDIVDDKPYTPCPDEIIISEGYHTATCTSTSADGSNTVSFAVNIDKTGPVVTGATPQRPPDQNGFYTAPISFTVTGIDALSGIETCPDVTYSGPDTTNGTVPGYCFDTAGNQSLPFLIGPIKYDTGGPVPVITYSLERLPDKNGWYNHPVGLGWAIVGADIASCIAAYTTQEAGVAVEVPMQSALSYAGPDTQKVTIVGKCPDASGSWGESDPIELKYDATAPAGAAGAPLRPADHNGWYNAPVVILFSGSDATSGMDTCSLVSYDGPDGTGITVPGTCMDLAGNTSAAVDSAAFNYDSTAPTNVTGAPVRPADHNGWYNAPVDILFSGTDNISGIESCTLTSYDSPDGTGITVPGTCTDKAGNTSAAVPSTAFNYDVTAPVDVSGAPVRPPDYNGWYNDPVDIQFTGTDATSGIESCTLVEYDGPDGTDITVPGSCTDNAGNTSPTVDSAAFDYDNTGPENVTGAPVRPPDHNGWYNKPVDIQFTSTDDTASIDTCTLVHYDGPDGTGITVSGTCTDQAGNTSQPVDSAAFNYDNTGPVDVSGALVRPPDHNGWYNEPVDVQFTGTDATSGIAACSLVHYDGPDGADVTASGFCEDVAGNTSAPVASAAFDYDNTDPVVTAKLDVDGPIYLHQPVEVMWGASDYLSGVDWDSSSCAQPDTSQVGPLSLVCQVWDLAGNGPATVSVGYSVIYRFTGFFRPVWEGWMVVKAGRTLPIKFRLADYYHVDVDGAAVSLAVTPVSCTVEDMQPYEGSTDIVEDLQPQKHGNYHYNWRTEKDETGCAQVVIDLQEGPGFEHLINIMWK